MPGADGSSNNNSGKLWPLVLVLAALFGWGAWQVVVAPVTAGDVYPPYSTLRADPLGAKVLFESLTELRDLKITRLYKNRTPLTADTALFVLGVKSGSWLETPEAIHDDYEKLLAKGGRIVVGFLPIAPLASERREQAGGAEAKTREADVEEHWGMRPAYRNAPPRKTADADDDDGDGSIPRESALYFVPGAMWRVLARDGGDAVVIERDLGKGTVVLVADSFRLSNQGLSQDPRGTNVAELVGPARTVVFDENHFGVTESGGVAVLLRKYHLEGAMAMLLVVTGLFIWRGSSSFLPARARSSEAPASGRAAREGLASLLRRGIPTDDLLAACRAEWLRSARKERRAELVDAELSQWMGRDPVEGYRAAARALNEKTLTEKR